MSTTSRRPVTQPRPTKASALRTSTMGPSSSSNKKPTETAPPPVKKSTTTPSQKVGSKVQASEGVRAFMSAQRSRLQKTKEQPQSSLDDIPKPRSGNVMTGAQRYKDHQQDTTNNTPNTSNLKSVIQQAKSSGRLELSHRHLDGIPEQIMKMYHVDPNSIVVDFSSSGGDAWYDAVELTKFVAAFNEITVMDERMGTEFGALKLLDFRNNRLKDLPPTLNQLRQLTTLHLPYNQFHTIPDVIFELTELRELVMAHNQITTLPDSIGNLHRLEILDLGHNQIGPHLPEGMGFLTMLRKLHMDHNQLVSLSPKLMTHWQKLNDLSMAHNRLVWFFAENMDSNDDCTLSSLVRLDLRHNNLRHLSPYMQLPKLKELLLADNSLTTVANDDNEDTSIPPITKSTDYSFLQHCGALLTLDVGSNQWTDIPSIVFDLTQLQRLDISNNQLRGLAPDLGLLPHLITLTWQGNPLRSVPRNISMTELIQSLRAAKISQQETTTTIDTPSEQQPTEKVADQVDTARQSLETTTTITTRTLDLSGQKLSEFTEALISLHSGVQTLRLSNNALTELHLTTCTRFSTTLVNLSLEQNKLTSFSLSSPVVFSALKTLNLANNRLRQFSSSASPSSFPVLVELDVTNNTLTDLPAGLSTQILPSLRILRCNSNRLAAIDPESVVNVEVLDIGNNDIAVLPPALGLNSSLRELTAYGNRFRVPQPSLLAQGSPAVLAFLRRRAGVPTD